MLRPFFSHLGYFPEVGLAAMRASSLPRTYTSPVHETTVSAKHQLNKIEIVTTVIMY